MDTKNTVIENKCLNDLLKNREKLENLVEVTFYVPCLNEENSIIPTLDKLVSVAKDLNLTFELIVYNDGSTDKTKEIVENYIKKHSDILARIINRVKRKGLGYNYIDGAFLGIGKYYMMICGDNSETEESLREILERRGSADIIIPYFGHLDKRSFARRNLSKLFTWIVNYLSGNKINYYNGVVLHLRFNVMRWHPMSIGFAYQAELLSIMLDENKSYVQVLISNNDRETGFSRAFYFLNFLSVVHSLLQISFRRIRRAITPK